MVAHKDPTVVQLFLFHCYSPTQCQPTGYTCIFLFSLYDSRRSRHSSYSKYHPLYIVVLLYRWIIVSPKLQELHLSHVQFCCLPLFLYLDRGSKDLQAIDKVDIYVRLLLVFSLFLQTSILFFLLSIVSDRYFTSTYVNPHRYLFSIKVYFLCTLIQNRSRIDAVKYLFLIYRSAGK